MPHLLDLFGRTSGLSELILPDHQQFVMHPALLEPFSLGRVPRASQSSEVCLSDLKGKVHCNCNQIYEADVLQSVF